MVRRTQSAAQCSRGAVASKITKACSWRIGRTSHQPRGLANRGNSCYRNAAIQNLLHLPKFVYWIMQHNEPGQNWPCRTAPNDINQAPPEMWKNEPAIKKLGADGIGCVPCLLKDLIRGYWGPILIDDTTGDPNELPVAHACWRHFHSLADRWFYGTPDDLDEILANKKIRNKTKAQKEVIKQQACADNMSRQHDSDEFMMQILNGIENTYDQFGVTSKARRRKNQYESLFTRTLRETITCTLCGHVRSVDHETPELGVRITPLTTKGRDDVASAVERSLTETLDIFCPGCSNPTIPADPAKGTREIEDPKPCLRRFKVVAAPEYLRIHVNFQAHDRRTGMPYKNRKALDIPDILDITSHMTYASDPNPLPVRYKLRHVLYHQGHTLTGGHYTAAVTQMPPYGSRWPQEDKFFCNDEVVTPFTNESMLTRPDKGNVLTVNPVNFLSKDEVDDYDDYDPSMIWYERILARDVGVFQDEVSLAAGREVRKGRGKRGIEYRDEVR